jgi:protein-disulfide isomerase
MFACAGALSLLVSLPAHAVEQAILATVDGKPVTLTQVEAAAADELQQLDQEFARKRHEALDTALERLLAETLLSKEAKARGISESALLTSLRPAPVSEQDIDDFYTQNQSRIPGSREQYAGQIRQFLDEQRMHAAYTGFLDELRVRYKVTELLQPYRAEVAAIGASLGPAEAPVTIVEFSDFECPYCVRIYPTLQQVVKQYEGKVRLVYRHFPLGIHANASKAAEASLCAGEQDRFWEMHNAMFDNSRSLTPQGLKSLAAKLGLQTDVFNSCLDSGKFEAQVARDMRDGEMVGVTGTPATFVNGRMLSGAVPMEQLTAIIDEELKWAGQSTGTD